LAGPVSRQICHFDALEVDRAKPLFGAAKHCCPLPAADSMGAAGDPTMRGDYWCKDLMIGDLTVTMNLDFGSCRKVGTVL
jgi:hypothetical protein